MSGNGGSSSARAGGWWVRRLAVVTIVALGLGVAVPSGALPSRGDFPMSWLWSWLPARPAWAATALVGVPAQQWGTAAGKDHYAPASATRANGGTGRAPGHAPGALPAARDPHPSRPPRWTTPKVAGDHSFQEGRSRRIAADSTARSDVYANPDGSFTRKLYNEVVNVKAPDGTWRPIDRNLRRDPQGRYSQKAGAAGSSFAARSDATDLATLRVDDAHAVSYALVNARSVAPQVSGDTVVYPQVLPGTDLRLSAVASGFKESLVLHSANAATSWVFPMRLAGLRARLEADGSVSLRDGDGTERASIPPGFMEDSRFDTKSGGFARSDAVQYELTTVAGLPALRVTADAGWLRDPARVFPVTVDPTTSLVTSSDTYVINTSSSAHWGEDELQVGTYDGGGHKARSLARFDGFDDTYGGAKITAASLKLFLSWAYTCTPKPFYVHRVTQSWSGATVTYPGPSYTSSSIGNLTVDPGVACTNTGSNPSVGKWVTVPLATAELQSWATGGANHGLAIVSSESDSTQWKKFTSANGPAGLAPFLSVTYTPNVRPQVDAQYPANGYAAPTLTPELLASTRDTDNWPSALKHNFQVFDKTGTKILESGPISARAWVLPPARLKWGETYLWTVIASDGHLPSTSQKVNVLSTSVPQPLITSGLADNGDKGFEPSVGNYTTSATDAAVATVGPALAVRRSYNSLDARWTAFGAGWSSMFDSKATEARNAVGTVQTVTVTYPNGQEATFGRNPDGTFVSPPGRFATFTMIGGYRLVDKDGTAYTFTTVLPTGQFGLSAITDAQGRALTLTYNAAKRPTKVTSASGRALHLTWSGEGAGAHVATVTTDPAEAGNPGSALTWTYTYTDQVLTKVCPPTSSTACTTYGYTGTAPRQPGAMLNAGPRSYWRLTEQSGTVAASAVLENQGTDNATYSNVTLGQPGPEPGTGAKAAGFNGTSASVKLPSKLVSQSSYQTLTMWFKTTGSPGGPLFSYSADPITNPTTPTNYAPGLYVGTSGKLYGQLWNGGVAPIATTFPVTDGEWHHVALTAGGNTQSLYVDGALIGTRAGAVSISATGSANEYLGAGFMGTSWPDQPRHSTTTITGYPTYFNGSIAEAGFFDRPLSATDVRKLADNGGAGLPGMLSSVTRPSGNPAVQVAYDTVAGTVREVTDPNGGVWKVSAPEVSGSNQVYAGAVLSAGPADYWRLGESGTVEAVNEVNGGTATYNEVELGVPGGPFDDPAREDDNTTVAGFNGTSSYMRLPDSDIPQAGPNSISMWFKMNAGVTTGGVLYSYQKTAIDDLANLTVNWTPALYVGTDGKLRGKLWCCGTSTNPITSNVTVNDGQWHHVVLAAGTTTQTLYLDGVAKGTLNAPIVATNAEYAYVGAGATQSWSSPSTKPGGFFTGQIAEVAYFRSQLSAAQVIGQFSARDNVSGDAVKTITVTDPGDHQARYVHALATGRKVAEVDTLSGRTQYGYDEGGFLRTVTDPNGDVTTTEHDVRGNTISSTTCQDRSQGHCSTAYYTYYPDATTRVLTPDPRNDVLLTMRDGRSTNATDNRFLTSYGFDAKGNRTSIVDPLGRGTTTAYTDGTTIAAIDGGFAPPGLPWRLTTPGGAVQTVVYYRSGDVAKVTDPAGKITTYTYDALGRPLTETETTDTFPAGLTTSYEYDGLGRLVEQTEPAVTNRVTGAVHTPVTAIGYDADSQVTSQTVSDTTGGDAPRTTGAAYNARGQQVTQTDPDGKVTRFEYDAYGRVIREIGADDGTVATEYDSEGRVLTSTLKGWTGDPNHPQAPADLVLVSNAYDPAGRLATQTDAMGWETSYTYTDNGLTATVTRRDPATGASFVVESNEYGGAAHLISQLTDNGTNETTFTVDAAGRTVGSTVDPGGLHRTTTYALSNDDYLLSVVLADPTGTVGRTEMTYDPLGRVTQETVHTGTAAGAPVIRTTYTLDQGGLATATTDPNGHTTSYAYDEAGRQAVTTGPAVQTETGGGTPVSTRPVSYIGYDTFGAAVESKDPTGNVTVVAYDAAGRVVSTRLPSYTPPGSATPITPVATRGYDALGQLTRSTDPLGKITRYAYDQLGRMSSVTAPDGGQSTFTYDLVGDQLSVTDPIGARSTATFDFLRRQSTATQVVRQTGASHTTELTYNSAGRLASTRSPAGVVSATTYNEVGEPLTVTDGAGNLTRFRYDGAGRRVRTTLPDGTYATETYDLAGRTTESATYNSADVRLATRTQEYDAIGNVTAATDARGTRATFAYDATGLLVSQVQPISGSDGITTSFGYDAAGNRTRFTDGRGNRFLTTYNTWGLPESRIEPATAAFPDAADRTFTATYDAAGRLASRRAPGGVTVTNTYDDLGNLTGQAGAGAEAATAGRAFGYDAAGRLTTMSGPGGTNTFSYDDRGLLLAAQGPSGNSSFTYNPDGAMATRQDAAGTTTYTYDDAGRLASLSNPTAAVQASLVYNALSQVRSIGYAAGNSRTLSYDSSHRLTSDELTTQAGATVAKIAYGYDANDNLTSKTTTGFAGSAVNTYTYDLADRLTSWTANDNPTVYAYDKSGNRVQAGSTLFTYDQRNQLLTGGGTAYEYTARGTLRRAGAVETLANAFDQVVTQQVAGGPAQSYEYDALGRMWRAGFSYSGPGNQLAGDGTATYTRDPSGAVVGVAAGSNKALAWTDQHTDLVGQFTATGTALTGSRAYDPLGKALASTGMAGNLGYQSEWTEQASGRVNMLSRWYNTATGQFDTRDSAEVSPVPSSVRANRFAYGDANPMTTTDPTGHWGWNPIKAVSSAVNAVKSAVSSAYNYASSAASYAYSYARSAYNYAATKVKQAASYVKTKAKQVTRYVAKKVEQGRKWVAKKVDQARNAVKKAYETAKKVGKAVVAKTTRVVKKAVNDVKDAYKATEKWVKEHKDLLIEIAAIVGGIAAGLACTAVTAGAGAVACMVGAAALINLAKDAGQGKIHNWGDAFGSLGTGAATGLLGAGTGAIGGRVAGALAGKLGSFAGSVGGRMLGGGVAAGVGDIAYQTITTGQVSLSGLAMSVGIGAITGGMVKGGGRGTGGGTGVRSPAGAAPEPVPAGRGPGSGCATHSFAPATRVAMADGTTRPIAEVNVGDKVLATDPQTGTTRARPVTALHLNRDADLIDVTVETRIAVRGKTTAGGRRAGGTRTAVLHTTAHHPFWDATVGRWTNAADLTPSRSTVVGPDGRVHRVTAVRTLTGAEQMRDLTVARTHTYYVIAGSVPVLVHNCGDGAEDRLAEIVDGITSSTPKRQRPGTVSESIGVRPSGLHVAVHTTSGTPGPIPDRLRSALTACGHPHGGCSEVSGMARLMELGAEPVSVTTMGIQSKRIGAALHKQILSPCAACGRLLSAFDMT